MRAGRALCLLLVLAVAAADASLVLDQRVTAQPAAAVPVTLAGIGGVNTVLGASLTNASIGPSTAVVLPILATPTNVLTIVTGALNWSVRLQVTATSGLAVGDSVMVSLGASGPAFNVTSGSSLPLTTTAAQLTAGGSNITVRAASGVPVVGGCGGLGSCTLTMQILLAPPGATYPAIIYPFTLRAT